MSYTDWFIPNSDDSFDQQPDGGSVEGCTMIYLLKVRASALWFDIPCAAFEAGAVICKMNHPDLTSRVRRGVEASITYFEPSQQVDCPFNTFRCDSGECIQEVFRCDGEAHCLDETDEADCIAPVSGCREDQFQCSTIDQCIHVSFHCDSTTHCLDGTDELDCVDPIDCRDTHYFCAESAVCIQQSERCNLISDCKEGEDEKLCTEEYVSSNNFQCFSGKWFPSWAKCDGLVDCIGISREDEHDCGAQIDVCNATQFRCISRACVDDKYRCIYDVDSLGYIKGCRDVSHLRTSRCENFECPAFHYKCPGSYCIPLRLRCDGDQDCPNGEDEDGCKGKGNLHVCPSSSYKCSKSEQCLSPYEVCDGVAHCPQKDDEFFCTITCPTECTCIGKFIKCNFRSSLGEIQFPYDAKKIAIAVDKKKTALKIINQDQSQNQSVLTEESFYTTIMIRSSLYHDLMELDVSDTNLVNIPPDAFDEMKNLRKLNLSKNPQLTDIDTAAFQAIEKLHELDLRGTAVTSNLLALTSALKKLTQIKTLYTDTFGFCCEIPLEAECIGYTNQFSSCDDLLKDVSLRAFMWILGLSALIGNAFALAARIIERRRAGRNPVQVMLITNLAVSDLVMGFYMITIACADAHYRGYYAQHAEQWTDSSICKFAGFLSVLSSEVSVLLVMLISIDRYLSVVFPFKTTIHLNPRSARTLVVAAWLFSLLLSTIPVMPVPYFEGFYGKSSVCLALPLTSERGAGWAYSIIVFICINFICFALTFLCYLVIYISVRRSHRRIQNMGAVSNAMIKDQLTMTTKMALVVGTDFVCWMPIIIMGILASSGLINISPDIYAWTAVFILPLNSALNPYLYTLSAVYQRRKEDNSDSVGMSQTTRFNDDKSLGEFELRQHNIILHESLFGNSNLEPITSYMKTRGGSLNDLEERLLVRDLRRAQCHLKFKGVTDIALSTSSVVVEKDKKGDMTHVFFVVSNWDDVKTLIGIGVSEGTQCRLRALWTEIHVPPALVLTKIEN